MLAQDEAQPLTVAHTLKQQLFYQTYFKKFTLINYLEKRIYEDNQVFIPKMLLDDLDMTDSMVKSLLPIKTKVIIQTRFYDFNKNEWIGTYGYWFQQTK